MANIERHGANVVTVRVPLPYLALGADAVARVEAEGGDLSVDWRFLHHVVILVRDGTGFRDPLVLVTMHELFQLSSHSIRGLFDHGRNTTGPILTHHLRNEVFTVARSSRSVYAIDIREFSMFCLVNAGKSPYVTYKSILLMISINPHIGSYSLYGVNHFIQDLNTMFSLLQEAFGNSIARMNRLFYPIMAFDTPFLRVNIPYTLAVIPRRFYLEFTGAFPLDAGESNSSDVPIGGATTAALARLADMREQIRNEERDRERQMEVNVNEISISRAYYAPVFVQEEVVQRDISLEEEEDSDNIPDSLEETIPEPEEAPDTESLSEFSELDTSNAAAGSPSAQSESEPTESDTSLAEPTHEQIEYMVDNYVGRTDSAPIRSNYEVESVSGSSSEDLSERQEEDDANLGREDPDSGSNTSASSQYLERFESDQLEIEQEVAARDSLGASGNTNWSLAPLTRQEEEDINALVDSILENRNNPGNAHTDPQGNRSRDPPVASASTNEGGEPESGDPPGRQSGDSQDSGEPEAKRARLE